MNVEEALAEVRALRERLGRVEARLAVAEMALPKLPDPTAEELAERLFLLASAGVRFEETS